MTKKETLLAPSAAHYNLVLPHIELFERFFSRYLHRTPRNVADRPRLLIDKMVMGFDARIESYDSLPQRLRAEQPLLGEKIPKIIFPNAGGWPLFQGWLFW